MAKTTKTTVKSAAVKKAAQRVSHMKIDRGTKKTAKNAAVALSAIAAAKMAFGAVKLVVKTGLLVAAAIGAYALIPASTQKRLAREAREIGAGASERLLARF